MTKRYIDFAPAKKRTTTAPAKTVSAPAPKPAPVQPVTAVFVRRTVVKEVKPVQPVRPVAKPVAKPVTPVQEAPKPVAKPAPKPETFEPTAKTFATTRELSYGVIEDYEPFFTAAKVEKRPLSTPRPSAELAEAKAKKVRSSLFGSNSKKNKEGKAPIKEAPVAKEPEFQALKTPDTPFVKSVQVEKRPLSKNVYKKPAPTPVEAPTGPVKIIDKPEKDSHIGPIIAIILTIILGAAVGTVAFLLLPKK